MATRDWGFTTLGDVTDWTSGGTPRKSEPSYWNGDIPWISASSMKSERLTTSDLKLTEAGLRNGSRIAESGSILLLVRGSELHKRIPIGIAGRPVAFNQDVKALRPRDGLLSLYLLYWLLANEPFLLSKVEHTGIGAGKLDTVVMKSLPLRLPPVGEQRAIVSILGSLDDKIELNRGMNKTLEEMAQSLFKCWFVDFDPVRAKMEGRQPTGMDNETAALFPDSFEDSTLGEIPKGWSMGSLGDVVAIHDSKRIPLSSRERSQRKGPYPYYGATSVMDYVDDYLFDGTYLLVGEDGSVVTADDHPVTQYAWGQFWVNNHAHVLQGKGGVSTEHVLLSLSQTNINAYVTGAVQPKLNQRNMKSIPFILASHSVHTVFTQSILPVFELFKRNVEQSRTLASIRDALLPKLLSGEIRVGEAVEQIEEVL